MSYHRKREKRSGISRKQGKLRLSVFRSNTHIYAQLIDDAKGCTLVAASSLALKEKAGANVEAARKVGAELAKRAKSQNIQSGIVFDRGNYRYAGRVKALAEAARESGLQF